MIRKKNVRPNQYKKEILNGGREKIIRQELNKIKKYGLCIV
jgi:hypothetical protein|tara:strand:- start:72 stop:194 length:123 start_codon:yes stop_codon:yes gene_type:complete